jgi:hypothetical protein
MSININIGITSSIRDYMNLFFEDVYFVNHEFVARDKNTQHNEWYINPGF